MTYVIMAPHLDDEWIGCGCTILEALEKGERIKVIVVTREERTENRIEVSKQLAQKYGYEVLFVGEKEKHINREKLAAFVKDTVHAYDKVYIPDYDTHPDHQAVHKVCREVLEAKQLVVYAVYNNSRSMITRIQHKFRQMLSGVGQPSFRNHPVTSIRSYGVEEKKENIKRFNEMPRGPDVLRRI